MWKVGDKIRLLRYGDTNTKHEYGFNIGQAYTIKRVDNASHHTKEYLSQEGYAYMVQVYQVVHQGQPAALVDWWIEPECFELIRKPPVKTEKEFLDRLKSNEEDFYA